MEVPQLTPADASPRKFWRDYISQRRPAVVHGVADSWNAFTDDYLISKAGDAVVMVEHRSGSRDTYGQGRKSAMLLRDFIRNMQQGNSNLYLSTQEVGVGRDGHPLLCGSPLTDLEGSFPLQQPLLGHLVPQSINMWMGCAPEGSSSGLHHDFHDNLYILLRGCKRFRLFPPSTAPDMYVRGNITHIYPNGRIVYEGQGDILPDGSNAHDVKLWKAHHVADAAAAAAAAASDAHEADEAEQLLEQQLELMLEEGSGCVDVDGMMDDYVDSDDVMSSSDEDQEETPGTNKQQQQQQQRKALSDSIQSRRKASKDSSGSSSHSSKHTKQEQQASSSAAAGVRGVDVPPPSFSAVSLALSPDQLRQRFPRFPGRSAGCEVVLQAGDMLFLPAGWFHEVTSFGGTGLDGGHLAINYWCHPPDNLDPSSTGFKQPYSSPYYPTLWANRVNWIQQETRSWWEQQKARLQQQLQKQQHGANQAAVQQRQLQQQQGTLQVAPGQGARHVMWSVGVTSPRPSAACTTRMGTASGSVDKLPKPAALSDWSDGYVTQDKSSSLTGLEPSQAATNQHGSEQGGKADSRKPHSGAASAVSAAAPQVPQDDEEHYKLGEEVQGGIDALEAYFGDNPEAIQALLEQFMAQRRAGLAAARRAGGMLTTQLPRLKGRRHHYTVVLRAVRRPKGRSLLN